MSLEVVVDTEYRIIEAAKHVFVRKGYVATTMGDIATEAGMGRTALHYYYRTKEMLFEALFNQLMNGLLPNIDSIMKEDSVILEKLPRIIEQYMVLLQQNPYLPIFVVNELNRDPQHLYQTILKDPSRIGPVVRLRKQIEEEMEKGLLRKMPLIYSVTTLMSLVIFPVLARDPFTNVFLNGDVAAFDAFLVERKSFVTNIMLQLFTPEENTPTK